MKESCAKRRERKKDTAFMRELKSLIVRHEMEGTFCYCVHYVCGLKVLITREATHVETEQHDGVPPMAWLLYVVAVVVLAALSFMAFDWVTQ